MDEKQLVEVLRYAEETAEGVPAWSGSARAVARIGRARRVRRRAFAAATSSAAIVSAITVAVWWSGRVEAPHTPDAVTSPAELAAAQGTMAEFDRQAAVLRVALASAREPQPRPAVRFASTELLAGQTAGLLLFEANELARQPDQIDKARRNYERVIAMFPQTRWARQAKQELDKINEQQPAHNGLRRQGAYL